MSDRSGLNPLDVTRENIDGMAQNRVSLIARDFVRLGIDERTARMVLMARGVNKWLGARRRIIAYKHRLRTEITNTIGDIQAAKHSGDHLRLARLRGRLEAKQEARKHLRAICHMPRWWPDDKGRYV